MLKYFSEGFIQAVIRVQAITLSEEKSAWESNKSTPLIISLFSLSSLFTSYPHMNYLTEYKTVGVWGKSYQMSLLLKASVLYPANRRE